MHGLSVSEGVLMPLWNSSFILHYGKIQLQATVMAIPDGLSHAEVCLSVANLMI